MKWPGVGNLEDMSSALVVALGLVGWTVLSIPLAFLVGRWLAWSADLTRAGEFHTLEA
jgi:hypothetical protein